MGCRGLVVPVLWSALLWAPLAFVAPTGELIVAVVDFPGAHDQIDLAALAQGYGWPAAPFRHQTTTWKVADRPATNEERAELLRGTPGLRLSPDGWSVDFCALFISGSLCAALALATATWWGRVRRPGPRGATRVALGAVGPWLVGTGLGWYAWELAGHPLPATPLLLDPWMTIAATALLLAVGLVLLVARRDDTPPTA